MRLKDFKSFKLRNLEGGATQVWEEETVEVGVNLRGVLRGVTAAQIV